MPEPNAPAEAEGPSLSRLSALRVVAAMLVVFLAAAWAQGALQERAKVTRQAELALTTIQSRVSYESLLQGRALEHRQIANHLDTTLRSIGSEIDRSLTRLDSSNAAEEVRVAVRSYQTAVDENLRLVTQGEFEQAVVHDQEKVDLWFEELGRRVDAALAVQRATAADTDRLADRGSMVALLLACSFVGLLLWRFERARTAAATVRQRVLQESEARFRALVQNSSDVITVVDDDGNISYQSPSAETLFSRPAAELVGTSFIDLVRECVHPDDLAEVEVFLNRTLSSADALTRSEFRLPAPEGQWRYVEATATNSLLDPFVLGIVITSRDISQRKILEEKLRHQAFHDSLTELPNRALLLDRMHVALARRSSPSRALALLLLDLDGFKEINDSMGHLAGDDLLKQVAERLLQCVRAADSVARLGGDEFALLLEDMTYRDDVSIVAERILDLLSQPFLIENKKLFVGASIGIVVSAPGEHTPDELLRDADVAMYSAKSSGKSRFEMFQPDMRAEVLSRLTLESDLRKAVERDELLLCYQPMISLPTREIVGMEALVRWAHPERGLISPADFIPLAEETGLIVPIGRWVLREACRQTKRWQTDHAHASDLMISVNISGRQLQEADLFDDVKGALGDVGLSPQSLTVEITESVLMKHTVGVAETLTQLRALGVRLAIDDFGPGYSSLGYLQTFPIEVLKIDKSFVARVSSGPEESAVARAIIKMAHTLGLDICAEGIEETEQLDQLVALGCPSGQGFLFAPPVPAGAAEQLIRGGADGVAWRELERIASVG